MTELTPEQNKKMMRDLLNKSEDLMAEMARNVPPQVLAEIENRVRTHFEIAQIPYHRANLKAFFQGMCFSVATRVLPNFSLYEPLLPGIVKLMLKEMDRQVEETKAKLEI